MLLVLLIGCVPQDEAFQAPPPDQESLILDQAFRIDVSDVEVSFVVDPAVIHGSATVRFTMRPGQTRALFHFRPRLDVYSALDALDALTLDGTPLDPQQATDLQLTQTHPSAQPAWEVQRDLGAGTHTLVFDYHLDQPFRGLAPGWFSTMVDDTSGLGNERMWPTINAPHELARHRIDVRMIDPRPYVMVGSGEIQDQIGIGESTFFLDTIEEVASYTVMVVAMPAGDVDVQRFDVGGVAITLASDRSAATTAAARRRTEDAVLGLIANLGPFPTPKLDIALIAWADGMEFYGGTITGLDAIEHELAHMYFGCSVVGRAWRDTWLDEALAVWLTETTRPLPAGFHSDIVSGRTPVQPAFDGRAYTRGGQIMQEVADALGSDTAMLAFLADLHARRALDPLSTEEFIEEVVIATGDPDMRRRMHRWLYVR